MPLSESQHALFVFDSLTDLTNIESLLEVLKSKHVHIIVLSTSYELPDNLIKEVDCKLVRACTCHTIDPLSNIHSTQRLVHTLMTNIYFAPTTIDQRLFDQLAEFTSGSPPIVEITSQILLASYSKNHIEAAQEIGEKFSLQMQHSDPHAIHNLPVRELLENVTDKLPAVAELAEKQRDSCENKPVYASWDSITTLVNNCNLSTEEHFLLNCLSLYQDLPLPFSLVTKIASVITKSTQQEHLASTLYKKLMKYRLLKPYPSPVVLYSQNTRRDDDYELVHIPQCVAECLWKTINSMDKVAALTAVCAAVRQLDNTFGEYDYILRSLLEIIEQNYTLLGKEIYQDTYTSILSLCRQ